MLLSIDDLQVSINKVPILHDVHLSLNEGDIYGLLGPNGAGKSTTINTALGLSKVDGGNINIFGIDVSRDGAVAAIRGDIGVLPEHGGFYDWMTAVDYLSFFASLYGRDMSREEINQRLHRVGLKQNAGQVISNFSQGMRQRLGLARALIPDPRLIILDEPTNGLDPRGRRDIHDTLSDLAGEGVGILLCTHLLDDVERLCSRIGIIVEGRTVAEGAIDDLLRNERHLNRFKLRLASPPPKPEPSGLIESLSIVAHDDEWWHVSLDAGTLPETLWRELFSRGWEITEIRREGGGIEDLYLSLTEAGEKS